MSYENAAAALRRPAACRRDGRAARAIRARVINEVEALSRHGESSYGNLASLGISAKMLVRVKRIVYRLAVICETDDARNRHENAKVWREINGSTYVPAEIQKSWRNKLSCREA